MNWLDLAQRHRAIIELMIAQLEAEGYTRERINSVLCGSIYCQIDEHYEQEAKKKESL